MIVALSLVVCVLAVSHVLLWKRLRRAERRCDDLVGWADCHARLLNETSNAVVDLLLTSPIPPKVEPPQKGTASVPSVVN